MENSFGLDVAYFQGKLELVLRDINNYTPDELGRELSRLAATAGDTRATPPLDPTEGMIEEGYKTHLRDYGRDDDMTSTLVNVYKAMIAEWMNTNKGG